MPIGPFRGCRVDRGPGPGKPLSTPFILDERAGSMNDLNEVRWGVGGEGEREAAVKEVPDEEEDELDEV